MMNLCSYLCVCWPEGFRSPTLLTSRVFVKFRNHTGTQSTQKKYILFPKLTSVSFWTGLFIFFPKKCLRLMGFPKKYVKLSPFHTSNQLQIIQITPPAICQADSRWSLAALAISMAGRKASPKLRDWKWEARLRNIMKHICVCYYRHDKSCSMYTYLYLYIYIFVLSKNTAISLHLNLPVSNTQSACPPQNLVTNTLKQHTLTPLKTQTPPNHGISGLQIYSLQWAIQDLKIGSCLYTIEGVRGYGFWA